MLKFLVHLTLRDFRHDVFDEGSVPRRASTYTGEQRRMHKTIPKQGFELRSSRQGA